MFNGMFNDGGCEGGGNYGGHGGCGGGFGGCTVSIVTNDAIDHFVDVVGKGYKEKTGHEAEFYIVEIGDGAKKL